MRNPLQTQTQVPQKTPYLPLMLGAPPFGLAFKAHAPSLLASRASDFKSDCDTEFHKRCFDLLGARMRSDETVELCGDTGSTSATWSGSDGGTGNSLPHC